MSATIQLVLGVFLSLFIVLTSKMFRNVASTNQAAINAVEDPWFQTSTMSTLWTSALYYFSSVVLRLLFWLLLLQIVPMEVGERAGLALLLTVVAFAVEGVYRHWFE
jgi:hypothetical protein